MIFVFISGCNISNNDTEIENQEINTDTKEEIIKQEPIQVIQEDKIHLYIENMTLEEKIAMLFIVTPEALTEAETGTVAVDITKSCLQKYPVAGLIYFDNNLITPAQVKEMTANSQTYSKEVMGLPLFISIDEEGGTVARIGNHPAFDVPQIQDMSVIGETMDAHKAYETGRTIGAYLNEFGFNLVFAPVADVLTNEGNTVVKKRSFGNDGIAVSDMVVEELKGLSEMGVYGTIKHFPGHGATEGDTHHGYAFVDKSGDELMENEWIPFQRAIEHGVSFVMVGHISVPKITGDDIPGTLSKIIIEDKLRNELNYDGIVITDALNMGAIVNEYSASKAALEAFLAGNDLLLMPNNFKEAYEGLLQAAQEGSISKERLDASLRRIIKVKMEMML